VRIIALKKTAKTYSCNAYLMLGDWNRVEDINTLIDPGIGRLCPPGNRTFPPASARWRSSRSFSPITISIMRPGSWRSKNAARPKGAGGYRRPGVDELLPDGRFIKAGNDFLEVIHTPGHSSDSICLYAPAARALFSGDTQLRPHPSGEEYSQGYAAGLKKLAERKIETIYSGHDAPLTGGCEQLIRNTLDQLRTSGRVAQGR
jgi:glyoxylase-like metal-dependent hydrolase (beta-lactamase superfamily II)